MTLDVLICTLGYDGINRVAAMNLPQVDGVRYLVSWQLPGIDTPSEIPTELNRNDISIYPLNASGLSVNRNHALSHATADICLIADDDLSYTPQQLLKVIEAFNNNPDIDIATFRYSGENNKWYPQEEFDLRNPQRGYYVSSIEIAFRREKVIGNISFNEFFGIGSPLLQSAEDSIFLHQAICRGLKGRFFPITITHHAGLSSGSRPLTPGVLMAEGAYIAIVYSSTALLRLPLFALRASRRGQATLLYAIRYLWKGYCYGKRYFNSDGSIKKMPPTH